MDDDDRAEPAAVSRCCRRDHTRPLYTDGLSLASDLLRRWPDTESSEARVQRLSFLSDFSCAARWDDVMLTTLTGW